MCGKCICCATTFMRFKVKLLLAHESSSVWIKCMFFFKKRGSFFFSYKNLYPYQSALMVPLSAAQFLVVWKTRNDNTIHLVETYLERMEKMRKTNELAWCWMLELFEYINAMRPNAKLFQCHAFPPIFFSLVINFMLRAFFFSSSV